MLLPNPTSGKSLAHWPAARMNPINRMAWSVAGMGSMAFGTTMGRTGAGDFGMTQPVVPPLCIDPLVTAMLHRAGTDVPPLQARSTSAAFAVRILLCCAVLCCAALGWVVLLCDCGARNAKPCCAVLCCIVLYRAKPCQSSHAMLSCARPYHTIPCRPMLCRAVLRCAALCCAVLCCAVLCQLEQSRAATSIRQGIIPTFLCLAMS